MARLLGDGDDNKAKTLGGGRLGSDVFSTGARGNLFLGQRLNRRHDQLLTAHAGVVSASVGIVFQNDGSGSESGGNSGTPGDTPGDNPGADGPGQE